VARTPQDTYLTLMKIIRHRLDLTDSLRKINIDQFSKGETAAFHGRKVVEGIAFGCLVATERGLKHVPRSAKGQWNAEKILEDLQSKSVSTFPSPSIMRATTAVEQQDMDVNSVIEGIPERRISHEELISIYRRFHRWVHEINPYTDKDRESFLSSHGQSLWDDLSKLSRFIDKHFIAISGEGFFCVLRDDQDGMTKIVSLSKTASI
jgi:hypothetical protein